MRWSKVQLEHDWAQKQRERWEGRKDKRNAALAKQRRDCPICNQIEGVTNCAPFAVRVEGLSI